MRPIFALILAVSVGSMAAKPVRAASLYSVESLKILCGTQTQQAETACFSFLHGVVSTWMMKDLVSIEPYRYQSSPNMPTFCETINKVSAAEWLRIVRNHLDGMNSGFATTAVMRALSADLCE